MTIWKIFVEVLFPIAFVLLFLLNVPAPRKFRHAVLLMVDKVLGFPLVGNFKLLHVVLVCTALSLAETSRQTLALQKQRATELIETPNVVTGLLAKKWRAERNFWLSFFCFTLWCLLASFYRVQKYILKLENRLADAGQPVPGAPATGKKHVRPSAPPLEPTPAVAAGVKEVQMAGIKKEA